MGYTFLIISLLFAITANFGVKFSKGFTRLIPGFGAMVLFTFCIYYLTLAIQYLEVSIVYAIWSGVSVAATTVIGIFFFRESRSFRKLYSILLIVLGVVTLEFYH